jgi:hypothetical protein
MSLRWINLMPARRSGRPGLVPAMTLRVGAYAAVSFFGGKRP